VFLIEWQAGSSTNGPAFCWVQGMPKPTTFNRKRLYNAQSVCGVGEKVKVRGWGCGDGGWDMRWRRWLKDKIAVCG
jgi:hypothetical protein